MDISSEGMDSTLFKLHHESTSAAAAAATVTTESISSLVPEDVLADESTETELSETTSTGNLSLYSFICLKEVNDYIYLKTVFGKILHKNLFKNIKKKI